MYNNPRNNEVTYSLDETAHLLNRSRADVEGLIRQKRLGFEMSDYGPVVTSSHIASFYLGERPRSASAYKPEGINRKPRKRYPKARTRR